jgi:hypothetical protein
MSIDHVSSQLSAPGRPMLFTRRAITLIDSLLLSLHYVSAIVSAPRDLAQTHPCMGHSVGGEGLLTSRCAVLPRAELLNPIH